MTSRSTLRRCPALVLVPIALMIGSAPCLASAAYSFTDLGLSDGGNLTFDAQGQIDPKTVSPHGQYIHQRSGPYSISWHYAAGRPDDLYRSLALKDGGAPLDFGVAGW